MVEPIGQIIKRLREGNHISQRKLSELSGVDRAYICQLEAGKAGSITINTAHKLAKGLGVLTSAFLGEPESSLQKLENIIQVPIYNDFPVKAGGPTIPSDYAYLHRVGPAPQTLEGYRVKGDCLRPEIQDGDIVIVDRAGDIDSGNIILCCVNDEVHIGRLRKIGGEFFLENNHARFKMDDISILAPVIEVVRRLK